ncbi:hypothetical protein ACJJTC_002517 [Scirpophaga incertulas]
MAEILKHWLTERLKRPIKWEADDFAEKMKNGYIIANLLCSYNVIDSEKLFLIRPTNSPEDLSNNWKYLVEWLKDLEIFLSNNELTSIKDGKSTIILRLFYTLFLNLDKRDRTNFIKNERKMVSTLVEKMKNRFSVEKVPNKNEQIFIDTLSKPLLDEMQYIEWQKKKTQEVKNTFDFIRHKYAQTLKRIEESETPLKATKQKPKAIPNTIKQEMDRFEIRYPCQYNNFTYEELIKLEEKTVEMNNSIGDSEWVKEYMCNLHNRMRKKSDSKEFQNRIRNSVCSSLWNYSVAEEEDKLNIELAKKVMKLSQFEKQMCTKIMETKQQSRNLIQNRIRANEEFVEQREQQYSLYLDNAREQIQIENTEINFEKQRQTVLHKKLYAEKMKRKRQQYYDICYETMLSIVDYATKYAYYKVLMNDEIPYHYIHEWKTLYFIKQPIFDILDYTEHLLKDEDSPQEEEEILRLELDRQNVLNCHEFEEYHNYSHLWNLHSLIPNYDSESEDNKFEYLGSRILGHVVYTLLAFKYPYPSERLPPDLPKYSVKAIVCGVPHRSITVAMQYLLNMRKVAVVRLESAINFCLKQFKSEMVGCEEIELSYDKLVNAGNQEENKELVKLMKIDADIDNKVSEPIVLGPLPPNTKQTQTPKAIPEEDIVLSSAAELGKYAYDLLSSGDTLTDYLLAAIIVEYLKFQDSIDGFAIINYPNTYREAQILEETLSGKSPPDENDLDDRDDIFLEEGIAKHRPKEKDQFKEKRLSKLVANPHKISNQIPFESYFTCYIKLKETEDILQEFVIWDLTEDNSEFIDRFYAVLGLNYSMYYEEIDKDFLAHMCKCILGDNIPFKSYDLLFGSNVLSLLDFPSSDDKRTKSKTVKPEIGNMKSKEKLRRLSKLSNLSVKNELKIENLSNIKENSEENVIVGLEFPVQRMDSKCSNTTAELNVMPGEEEWVYGNIPIVETIAIALATCWEEIENTYIKDIQKLFFAKRLQMNCLVPYARFIKDKMYHIITLPSSKQDIVCQFQKQYNEFETDWRSVNVTKNEWHCRIKELQTELHHICDKRKVYAEQQRRLLISENWAMDELTSMANTYISLMQTELNRSILTFQILHDFYFSMLKHLPPNERLALKDLTKIYRDSDETSGSKKGGEDKVYKQLKSTYLDLQLNNIEFNYGNNPFNSVIENNVKFAIKVIKDLNDSYRSLISREYTEISKIAPNAKRKNESSSQESLNTEEIFKENALKCVDEWVVGINGEMYRAYLRMSALQYKCYRDMKLFSDHISKTFNEIQNDINSFYANEIKAVDRLCKYLQLAIETDRKIPESLLLVNDTFVIDPNLLQFAPPEPPIKPVEVVDNAETSEFKLSQLARLRSAFKIIAPTGIILQQEFIYTLQDFIFFGNECCEGPVIPEEWKRVDPEKIPKLVNSLFGDTVYIDWREFLIYCLNIRFPTIDELLHVRKLFRCFDLESTEVISRNDFIEVALWFEDDFDITDKCMVLRKHLIKHFLFELYECSQNYMNYSAFLLAFCKSLNSIEGFVTALSMVIGNKICFSGIECEEVVSELIKQKQYRDECLACALECSKQFLSKAIDTVITICEGTSIIELENIEPSPEIDKKRKKSKFVGKLKKAEPSQSARVPKNVAPNISKTTHSVTNMKITYNCPPCEEDIKIIEEKPSEIDEENAEQIISQPSEDPNLVYAVSQDVIWRVLNICLPEYFKILPEEKINSFVEKVLEKLEGDTVNGDIYVGKFVSDPNICKLLHKNKKFTIVNLKDEIRKILF